MTKIEFHQLSLHDEDRINLRICELLFSLYNLKHHVYVFCSDSQHLWQLDEFIITYQQTNFFPYQIINEGPIPPAPICLGTEAVHKLKYDILLNLTDHIPENFRKYKKIIQFIPSDLTLRNIARLHYKHYAKYNCQITIEQPKEPIEPIEPIKLIELAEATEE